jgi:phage antirepressor YoqD-like protein
VAPPVEETPEAKLLAGVMWLQAKCADQAKQIVEAAPKVEHYDLFADAKGRYGLQQAARILGQHPNKWIEQLVADGYLHRQGGKPVPKVDYLGRYFEVKEVLSDGKAFCQTYVTPKGLEYFGARVGSLALVEGPKP